MKPSLRLFQRKRAPEFEAAARGKRALDHLARKRERERQRLERARHEQEIRETRRLILTVATPICFVAAVVLGVVVAEPVFELLFFRSTPLERVAVQGASALSPAAIAAGAGVLAGIPLDRVDPETVLGKLANEPWIESARVLRLPTGTLVVNVVERRAVARWRVLGAQAEELVDPKGSRFPGAIGPGGALPLVHGDAGLTGILSHEALQILQEIERHASLANHSAALTLHLPRLAVSGDALQTESASGYVLEFGHEGARALLGHRSLSQRVARLAALLDEDQAMVRTAELIDLRYADRAVLRTGPTSG